MVSMEGIEGFTSISCCMRKNNSLREELTDTLNSNIILYVILLISYYTNSKIVCIGTLLCMLVNSVYLINLQDKYLEYLETFEYVEENEDPEEYLSLKQREHGARYSRGMTQEQEDALMESIERVKADFKRRNARNNLLERTPTETSLYTEDDTTNLK